jgi:uncharacterized protein
MTENNKAVLLKANSAITKGDYEGFLMHCAEDTEWTFVGDRMLKGKEAVRQWMATTYIEPPKFNLEQLISDRDTVIALGTITLKDDEGQIALHSYCDVWTFRDGKISELKAFVIASPETK